ncbi:MAG: hypothetical protein IJV05_03725 [Muribaculaceae bacterium]|nr:hypothetical protein [Muribaculaceae bacterium]
MMIILSLGVVALAALILIIPFGLLAYWITTLHPAIGPNRELRSAQSIQKPKIAPKNHKKVGAISIKI